MSIFKETLARSIQVQLQARTQVVKGNETNNYRNQLLPWYLSKNSWVRMTSFTNYTSGKVDLPGKGNIKTIPDGHYTGDNLSKKYILEGGTLYTKANPNTDLFAGLRYGMGEQKSAYASNIDVRPDGTKDPQYFRTYGIRPMPGITGVNLHTIGAYGSLFETTVKYYAWDIHQLNELELLFMRPGYSVLLEWGWSQYLDYDEKYNRGEENESLPSDISLNPQVFNGVTINPFDETLNQDKIYKQLDNLRKKYKHNYDGMLGYVKNFSWKMMKNGGYECSTTLISMGEVINTLKVSTNFTNFNKPTSNTADFTKIDKAVYKFDDYENILLSLKSSAEGKRTYSFLSGSRILEEKEYNGTWDIDREEVKISQIWDRLEKKGYSSVVERLKTEPVIKEIDNDRTTNNFSTHGDYFEYISFPSWMAIMGSYFNFESSKTQEGTNPENIVKILTPSLDDYCLASKDSISTDLSVCLINNSQAFVKEFQPFKPPLYKEYKGTGIAPIIKAAKYDEEGDSVWVDDQHYSQVDDFYEGEGLGRMANIYLNLDLLLKEYKGIKESSDDEGVNLTTYINNILKKVSNSLGGLNNFTLSTAGVTQNELKVIDLYYLEKNSKTKSSGKYSFDLMGLGSICRDVQVESQIFQEQSTIVAIAAQSRANLGSIYNSTQVYLNAGLEDRLAINKQQGDEKNDLLNAGNPQNYFYQKLFEFLIYVRNCVVGTAIDEIDPSVTSINSSGRITHTSRKLFAIAPNDGNVPYTFLKQFMLKYSGELNFKALIPFKLKITLDGIGGIVVGQVFKVNPNVLPKNYIDKNLGFVVTKISHDLERNDWSTTLETQICILDQDQFFKNGNPKLTEGFSRQGFLEFVSQTAKEAIIWPVLVEFMEYQALRSICTYLLVNGENNTFNYLINKLVNKNFTLEELKKWQDRITNFTGGRGSTPGGSSSSILISPNLSTGGVGNDNDNDLVKNYYINQFTGYFEKWAKRFKTLYPEKWSAKFSESQTLGQVIEEIIKNTNEGTSINPVNIGGTQNFENTNLTVITNLLASDEFIKYLAPIDGYNIFEGVFLKSKPSGKDGIKNSTENLNNKPIDFNRLRTNVSTLLIQNSKIPNIQNMQATYETISVANDDTLTILLPLPDNTIQRTSKNTKTTMFIEFPLDEVETADTSVIFTSNKKDIWRRWLTMTAGPNNYDNSIKNIINGLEYNISTAGVQPAAAQPFVGR